MVKTYPNLLITGATGFTGLHACRHFIKEGFNVTGVTSKDPKNYGVPMEQCDLTSKECVMKLIKKIKPQYILHLAGQNHVGNSWKDPITTLEVNSFSTMYLLEAVRKENLNCRIIIVGSALQFDTSNLSTLSHPYSLSKTFQVLISQSWAKLYGLDIVIVNPTNIIGPGQSKGVCSIFAQKIVEMEKKQKECVLQVNNLYAQRDFVDVRDVVCAFEILFNKGISGEIYDVSSGESYTIETIIEKLRSFSKENIKINASDNYDEIRKVIKSPDKLVKLGWKRNKSLDTSLRDTLNFFRGVSLES